MINGNRIQRYPRMRISKAPEVGIAEAIRSWDTTGLQGGVWHGHISGMPVLRPGDHEFGLQRTVNEAIRDSSFLPAASNKSTFKYFAIPAVSAKYAPRTKK